MEINLNPQRELIAALEVSLKEKQAKKEIFTKVQGLAESAEKIRAEVAQLRAKIEAEKEGLAKLVDKKTLAVKRVLLKVMEKMNAVLPAGEAILRIDDSGGLFVGWRDDEKKPVAYSALSGGEKVAFDQALVRALGGTVLIVEAAELDPERLHEALDRYGKTGLQVLVSSCHEPTNYPDGWKAARL